MVSFIMRKLITRDTDYAVRTLILLAERRKEIVLVSELVKRLEKGYLNHTKAQAAALPSPFPLISIFLVDLIKIFQGPVKLSGCFLGRNNLP